MAEFAVLQCAGDRAGPRSDVGSFESLPRSVPDNHDRAEKQARSDDRNEEQRHDRDMPELGTGFLRLAKISAGFRKPSFLFPPEGSGPSQMHNEK